MDFYWVLIGFTVLLGYTAFNEVSFDFSQHSICYSFRFFSFYQIFMSFLSFYWVFIGFHLALLDLTGFQ